jgi:hypothetical protein
MRSLLSDGHFLKIAGALKSIWMPVLDMVALIPVGRDGLTGLAVIYYGETWPAARLVEFFGLPRRHYDRPATRAQSGGGGFAADCTVDRRLDEGLHARPRYISPSR